MADAQNLLMDWLGVDKAKSELYATNKDMVLRWFNEANQRYCDKAEVIRDIWTPTIDSTGQVELPDDWLREVKDRVKLTDAIFLRGIAHGDALIKKFQMGTYWYSIWMHTFYVWAPIACTPTVLYIRRPTDITSANIARYTLDLHREDHFNLMRYLDARWARHTGDIAGAIQLEKLFDAQAEKDGQDIRDKYEVAPRIRSAWF